MKKKTKSLESSAFKLSLSKPIKPVAPYLPPEFISERVVLYRGSDVIKVGDYPDDAYIESRSYNENYWASSSSYDDITTETIIYQEVVKENVEGKAQYEAMKALYEADLVKYKEAMKLWNKESLALRKELKKAEEELKRKEKEEMGPLRTLIMEMKRVL